MTNIGVLALQGSVAEHLSALGRMEGVKAVEVKKKEDLLQIDGIILPGGESTTMAKLLKGFGLFSPIKEQIELGLPVWGTCAGLILLAKRIVDEKEHFGVMDITVRRNAYGRQIDSFKQMALMPKIAADKLEVVFIRAPWIEKADGATEVLGELDGKIIAAKENNMLATSFHPELTDDLTFHKFFVAMCRTK